MKRLQHLIQLIKPFYESPDPAHDWAHVGRVAATAKKISDEMGAKTELVLAAVYCHDIVNLPKDHPERKNASTLCAERSVPFLRESGFNDHEIEIIQKGIIEHSFSKGLKPSCIESAIVQDADRLDTLGAIGVLRCASVNTQMKGKFYDPFDPLAENRDLDDKTYMLDHYFVKIFKLPGLMNTDIAKKIADERVAYMKEFMGQLMKETR